MFQSKKFSRGALVIRDIKNGDSSGDYAKPLIEGSKAPAEEPGGRVRVADLPATRADFGEVPDRLELVSFDDVRRALPVFHLSPTRFLFAGPDQQTK